MKIPITLSLVKKDDLAYITNKPLHKITDSQIRWADGSETREVITNEYRSGFKILGIVSRYSTSNKVFEIMHPLGFRFQIYSDNFEDILLNCNIHKGEIMNEIRLGYYGSIKLVYKGSDFENEFLVEESDKKAMKTSKFNLKDLQVGKVYKIGHKSRYYGNVMKYIGKYRYIVFKRKNENDEIHIVIMFRHIFLSALINEEYYSPHSIYDSWEKPKVIRELNDDTYQFEESFNEKFGDIKNYLQEQTSDNLSSKYRTEYYMIENDDVMDMVRNKFADHPFYVDKTSKVK